MSRWLSYLANDRAFKLNRVQSLASGWARMQMVSDGEAHDITEEELQRLREDVAEEILVEEGCSFPDA